MTEKPPELPKKFGISLENPAENGVRMAWRWTILALLGVLAVAVVAAFYPRDPEILPAADLVDDVYYSPGHLWFEFYALRAPKDGGWVHLPQIPEREPFVSGIDPHAKGFVKPQVCAECHPDQYEEFPKTAHFLTSSLATPDTVLGDFSADQRILETQNPNLHFEMEAEDDGFYQRVVIEKDGKTYEHRERFDLVTGSGVHGQTYLYWATDRLCQLPISYFTELGGWVNSPGYYRDGTADFARGIGQRCLDCHATFFAPDYSEFNRFDKTNFVLGVTCVRCHGPGWAHVQYHREHPEEKESKYITNPASLSQQRANEVCAQCHSGVGVLRQPAFSYPVGEPLADYLELDMDTDNTQNDDPHAANQLLRLMKSKCFQQSENMTCATCHDPHRVERGDMKLFADRCAKCHDVPDCGLHAKLGGKIESRCVQCHMPSRRDSMGGMATKGGVIAPLLRDHYIKPWDDVTQRVLEELEQDR